MLSAATRALHRLAGDEDGSTILMYPFAILIVFAVGAIAIDAAVLFQAHRQAVDVASGIASDVAGVIDEGAFVRDGELRIDRDRAVEVLAFANEVDLADHPNDLRCSASIASSPPAVVVSCSGRGQALLLPLGGRSDGGLAFTATARATPVEGA